MDTVLAFDEVSRRTALVPRDHFDHPILGANMREVDSDKKRGRLSEIVKDAVGESSANRVTNVVTPDKDKEDR